MTLDIKKAFRQPFEVAAVQVTPENMEELAKWCGGKILEDDVKGEQLSRSYIKVNTPNPTSERQKRAYMGDWILKSKQNFKIFTRSAFQKNFEIKE